MPIQQEEKNDELLSPTSRAQPVPILDLIYQMLSVPRSWKFSAHQASVRVIQDITSQRCFEGWQEEGNKVGYAFFQLSIFEFRRDSCIYDQSCVLCSARSSKDVQAGRERSGIKEVGRVDGSSEEANRGTRGSGTEGARA